MGKDVIIALDFPDKAKAMGFLERLGEHRPYVKVGMELFYSAGPDFITLLKEAGYRVFLDLKLHDIPNTVSRAMGSLSRLGADMTNLHAAGGVEMMRAAVKGLTRPDGSRPLLVAVTMLTSTGGGMLRDELLISSGMNETVLHYAKNAMLGGLDGVVCSPLEAERVKSECGAGFLTVTPGIRFADSAADDQKRTATPEQARGAGCDYIVVGRPVTGAENPREAYKRCLRGFLGK